MRNCYQDLRPNEIIQRQLEKSIVYLPVGPLEWHGPAMPMGTDPVLAEAVAQRVVQRTGGILLPTLYAGTERERTREVLDSMGFDRSVNYVIGQDVPANILSSLYFREEVFALLIREYLRLLSQQKFQLIVIVNGHGAENQVQVLERLAVEFTNETNSNVMVTCTFQAISENDQYEGHATKAETSLQMYIRPDNVDLQALPPKSKPLKNTDWGINGGRVYALRPNRDGTVEKECDPRDASVELGKRYFQASVDAVVEAVNEKWIQINSKQC